MLTLEEEIIKDDVVATDNLVEINADADILNLVNVTTIARRVIESKFSNLFSSAHRAAHSLAETLEDALYDETDGFVTEVDGKLYMQKTHVDGLKKLLDVVKADTLPIIAAYRSGKLKSASAKKMANTRVRVYNSMERSFAVLFGEEYLAEDK